MEQVLFGGGTHQNLDDTLTEYNSLIGQGSWTVAESSRYKLISADGHIKNLRVRLDDGAGNPASPGAGKHYDFTLMVNGAPTALTLEIADAATSGSNMVNAINVAPGNTVSLQCDPDNTPTVVYPYWTTVFEGDTPNESIIMGGSNIPMNNTDTTYSKVMMPGELWGVNENNFRSVVPTSGTIKDFYVKMSEAAGVGVDDAYRFTVRLNGATVAQSLIVTLTQPATTGSDLAHNLAVVAGNVLTMMIEPLNTPSATPSVIWGMTFVADIDGESIVLGGSWGDLNATVTEYNALISSADLGWLAAEVNRYQLGQVCTLRKLYILLSAPPGDGNSYDFTLRIAVANSNVTVHIHDTDTTGNSAALTDIVANDEYVDLQVVPTSTPDVVDAYWGFVSYRGFTGKISGVVDPAKIAGVASARIQSVKGVA